MKSSLKIFAAAGLALSLGACAMAPMGSPTASMTVVQGLRQGPISSAKVAAFTAAKGMPDKKVTARAGAMAAPDGGTFAQYLQSTIVTNLTAAGKLDPNSGIVIGGELNESDLSSALPKGHAALGAKITVTRNGRVVFDKQLHVESEWESSFIGAVAIPDALNHYSALYSDLAEKLFADPEFRAALA